MANRFYFHSGSAGHTSSDATAPGYILQTFRPETRGGTSSIAVAGTANTQSVARAGVPLAFISQPILGTFTLSGSVTCSAWGLESGNAVNSTVGFRLWHKSASLQGTGSETAMMTAISSSLTEFTTAVQIRPITSVITNTVFNTGDRIVCRLYATGNTSGVPGNMGTGTVTLNYGAVTSGSNGDAVLIFSQNIPLKKKIYTYR